MKTRVATSYASSLIALSLIVAACGAPEPRYDDKSYGQKPKDANAVPIKDEEILSPDLYVDANSGDGVSGDGESSDGAAPIDNGGGDSGAPSGDDASPVPPVTDGSAPVGDEGGEPPSDSDAGDAGEDGTEGETDAVNEEEPIDDIVRLPPDALIKHARYRARFDQDSVRGIRNNSGYRNLNALVANQVKSSLTTTVDDGLVVAQTFGDGVARSVTRQAVKNSAGDANRGDGEPSSSHQRLLDRVVGGSCPGPFICSDRMVYAPTEGAPMTVCFYDNVTGSVTLFPYGAAPNYTAKDFEGLLKVYGPYRVKSYAGANNDCSAPVGAPLADETIVVETRATDQKLDMTIATEDPLTPQFAVEFENRRLANDLNAPYIDETVRLNHRTIYGLNESARELAKLVVTTRMSIDIGAQAGGGFFGGIANLLVNIDGIIVDLHFEYCKNELDANAANKCP